MSWLTVATSAAAVGVVVVGLFMRRRRAAKKTGSKVDSKTSASRVATYHPPVSVNIAVPKDDWLVGRIIEFAPRLAVVPLRRAEGRGTTDGAIKEFNVVVDDVSRVTHESLLASTEGTMQFVEAYLNQCPYLAKGALSVGGASSSALEVNVRPTGREREWTVVGDKFVAVIRVDPERLVVTTLLSFVNEAGNSVSQSSLDVVAAQLQELSATVTLATPASASSAGSASSRSARLLVSPPSGVATLTLPSTWVLRHRGATESVFETPTGERSVPNSMIDSAKPEALLGRLGAPSALCPFAIHAASSVQQGAGVSSPTSSAVEAPSAAPASRNAADAPAQIFFESPTVGVRFAIKEGATSHESRVTALPTLHYSDDALVVTIQRAIGALGELAGATALPVVKSKGLDPQNPELHGLVSSLAALFGVPRADLFPSNVAGVNGLSFDEQQDATYCRTFLIPVSQQDLAAETAQLRDLLVVRWEAPVSAWNPKAVATFRQFMDSWSLV